ncbi:hypothetical protein JCM3770_003940 [Rhodotorula araucariae]
MSTTLSPAPSDADLDGLESPVVPRPPAQTRAADLSGALTRSSAPPPTSYMRDSVSPTSSPPARARALSPVPRDVAGDFGRRSPALGLGLGMPVELDELLEAGEAFSGLGAGSDRPLSASTTISAASASDSSHISSPPMSTGAFDRAERWSAASTAATSMCDDEGRAVLPPSGTVQLPEAAAEAYAPHAQRKELSYRSPQRSSLTARSAPASPGECDSVATPVAPSAARVPDPIPERSVAGHPHAAPQPSLCSSVGTVSTSPRVSASSPREKPLPSDAHAHADPRSTSRIVPLPPVPPHSDAWAPPEDLDDEERVVLGAVPIFQPAAMAPPRSETDSGAAESGGERAWGVGTQNQAARRELGRSSSADALVSTMSVAHPFSASPSAPPVFTVTEPPDADVRWMSASAGPSTSPRPSTSSSAAAAPNKRTSMFSTLASPFAGLSRSKSAGAGEGRRRYRLSVIGEASSSASASPSPSSAAPSSRASSTSSESARTRTRASIGSSVSGALASFRPRNEPHVHFSPAPPSPGFLPPPSSKAARLLGLAAESVPPSPPVRAPSPLSTQRHLPPASPAFSFGSSPDLSFDSAFTHGEADSGFAAGEQAMAQPGMRVSEEASLDPRQPLVAHGMGRDERWDDALPRWPARRDEIARSEVLSADIYKLASTPTSLLRAPRTLFRPRFVALAASPHPSSSSAPRSYHLHAFKSRHASESETARLALTPCSIVCAPAAADLPPRKKDHRAYTIKVTGFGNSEADERPVLGETAAETGWIVGMDDEGVFREWLARLKAAVRELRGEGDVTSLRATVHGAGSREQALIYLDEARRAADEAVRLRSPSVSSGVGTLVLTSQGWQLEDVAARASPSPHGRSRIPSAGSSSWTDSSRASGGEDADASSVSGASSVYSRGPSSLGAARPPMPPAGDSFLDADSSDDEDVDMPTTRTHPPLLLSGSRSSYSSLSAPPASPSRRTFGQSSTSSRESHLPPALPPPATALPPLPPRVHSSPDNSVVFGSTFNRLSLASSSSHPSLRSTCSAPAAPCLWPPHTGRCSVRSSRADDSLPPARPPPKGALPPVPPSPDLAQLERQLARSAPSAEHARRPGFDDA